MSETWQVIQLTLLQRGHLNTLTSSSKIVQPAQSGVLQWKVFVMLASASFIDFFWCFSNTAGVTSCKNILCNKDICENCHIINYEWPCKKRHKVYLECILSQQKILNHIENSTGFSKNRSFNKLFKFLPL